ncbi:MAG TPA: hypothetical protein VGR90_02615, partial [Acidimicrobiales bacterium]|nr:hypothetical protein [Acidimicrobiales bacterium]
VWSTGKVAEGLALKNATVFTKDAITRKPPRTALINALLSMGERNPTQRIDPEVALTLPYLTDRLLGDDAARAVLARLVKWSKATETSGVDKEAIARELRRGASRGTPVQEAKGNAVTDDQPGNYERQMVAGPDGKMKIIWKESFEQLDQGPTATTESAGTSGEPAVELAPAPVPLQLSQTDTEEENE